MGESKSLVPAKRAREGSRDGTPFVMILGSSRSCTPKSIYCLKDGKSPMEMYAIRSDDCPCDLVEFYSQ